MKTKKSLGTLIILSVVITLFTSLQIASSSPSIQSNPHPIIEIRPLQDSVTVTPQPFAYTSEDYVQVQDAIVSALSNYPTASLADIKIDGQWAYGIVKLADTNEFLALAHLLPNSVWQIVLPDNGTVYSQWLNTLPENLIPPTEKEILLTELPLSLSDFDSTMLQDTMEMEFGNWIADSRFAYVPNIDDFNVHHWLDDVNSSVNNCDLNINEGAESYADFIIEISEETGVNPRVLLVMSEITHGIISKPDLDCNLLLGYKEELLDIAQEMMQATAMFSSRNIFDQAIVTPYVYSRLNTTMNSSSFGVAMGIAISAATYQISPYDVEKDFYDFYSSYFGDPKTPAPYMEIILDNLDTVTFLMPFIEDRTYAGGPHGVGYPPGCNDNDTPVAETSGIDFGGGVDWNDPFDKAVISIASGTIVGIKQDTTLWQGGRWVAVEHSNNVVSMYWHLSSINPSLYIGQSISSGAYLGDIGNSGLPSGDPAHIHLELRTGGSDYSTWGGKGAAVYWSSKEIDGWRIYPEINAQGFAEGYNGSAVRSAISTNVKNISTNCGWVDAGVENGFPHTEEINYPDGSNPTTVFAFEAHETWFQSHNSPNCPGQLANTAQAVSSSLCGGGGTLEPPILISPNNGQTLNNRSVHFVWQSPNSTNQNGYTFRLSTSSNPDTQPWIVDTGLGNEYTSYDHAFSSDGTFYWHMRTWNTSNEASAWVTRQFHIDTSGGSGDVVLCGTDDASSDCWGFPLGIYSDLSTWGLNDRMRSAIVPSGKSVFLFREGGLRGTAECFSGNRIPLPSGDPWDLRGQVTGVQVFHQSGCPTSQLYSVVMYDNQNYGSHHWGIGYNEGVHNLNQIGGPDDAYFNDRGESVRIPSGWSVRLYEHNDRGGQSSGCLTGDVLSLGSLNNTVSSVELFHNTTCTPPTPSSPTNLSVSGTTENSISLAWQDNSNIETGFKIYRWGWNGTDWDFLYLNSVGTNVTTYTDTGLNCGESYYYTVSATNGSSESSQASWVQGDTNVCPNVEVTGAWTGDGNWNPKSTFDPDDSIQWALTVVNTTGADADIELSYDAYGSNGEHILDWTDMVTVSNGGWNIALSGTVPNGMGGTHAFDGLGDYQGHVTLATTTYFVTGPSAPVNNDFNSPTSINYVPFNYTQTIAGATTASDDPSFNCGPYFSGTGFQSLWYRYTPSTNDFLTVNTFGSDYDTILAIWTGQRGNLQLQGCNDDNNGGLQSQAGIWAFAGTIYYIEVLSHSDGSNGSLTLEASAEAPNHIYLPLIIR